MSTTAFRLRSGATRNTVGPLLKRSFDALIAAAALVALAPALVSIAVAIVVDSGLPVFYRQTRIGRDGQPFSMYKFRTMVVGADRLGANISPEGDARITHVGRLLRGWYLDELPQLVNVVRGRMSLVGPRPETPEFVALYDTAQRQVLSVRPGMLGPSTLAGMAEERRLADAADPVAYSVSTVMPERIKTDLGYIEDWSFGRDLSFVGKQFWAIARRRR